VLREAVRLCWKDSGLVLLRMVLENCPNEPVAAASGELSFLKNHTGLQEDLARDIEEAKRSLSDREWKGATVVAGSVVEALLLWAIDQKTAADRQTAIAAVAKRRQQEKKPWSSPPAALEDWKLYQFVAVAAELALIDGETEKQADLARDFRNYIHPAR
jgi:hypothetical protein